MSRRGENIYKRKDGRYEGRYVVGRTEKGRTKFGYVYGRQYNEVKDMLIRRKTEQLAAGRASSERRTAFACCMRRWMNELRGTVKQSSYQTYTSLAEKHVLPSLGALPLAQITATMMLEYAERLMAEGLSAITVKGICRLVSACLRWAQEEGYIAKNPCRRLRFNPEQPGGQRVLTGREQEKLNRAAAESSELPVLLAAYLLGAFERLEEAAEARRAAEAMINDRVVAFYNLWKTKADADGEWAERNPISINILRRDGELLIDLLPAGLMEA